MACGKNLGGEPEAGTRKTLEIKRVEFPFWRRPPGMFTMNPENEDGRCDDNILHEITLARGLGSAKSRRVGNRRGGFGLS